MILKEIYLALALSALTLSVFHTASYADKAQMDKLVPDVTYQRKTSRTHVFSRAQWKYGLQRRDYLNRWVDQPLFVDPSLDDGKGNSITYPSFRHIQETVIGYGLDGMGFFPQTSGRAQVYERAIESGLKDFRLLTEFVPGETKPSRAEVLKMALDNPYSQRINGKVVILSYRADTHDPEWWANELKTLREQYGDTFIFLPSLSRYAGESDPHWIKKYHDNTITAQEIESIKKELREWISATDGIYVSSVSAKRFPNRKLDEDYYRNFIIRIMKSVLAEPEFKEKYFGLSAMVGHENPTRVGSTFSSDATKTLRHSLTTALEAQPDIINMAEWDEQNENTSVRPTVYNGTSTQRILRYYTGKQRGKEFGPLPGDDVSVPNLIISYRKLLVLGEELDIELLNVPDTDQSTFYTARLMLEDLQGNTVYTSPTLRFQHSELQDHTLNLASETLARYQVLRPKLEIEANGKKSTFQDGLHYIELRASWNWDYKWIKQPLRDLLKPSKVEFTVGEAVADGARAVTASFETNEPLAYVQVLDNDNIVYIVPPADDPIGDRWRENEEQVVISINWQSRHSMSKPLWINGDITLKNADAKWLLPGGHGTDIKTDSEIGGIPVSTDPTITFKRVRSSNWIGRIFVAVPRTQINRAELEINLPDLYQGTIPIKEILDNSIFGIPGPGGFNMVINRYLRQDKMPNHLNRQGAQFTALVWPDLSHSVLHLQAIGKSGRIYRSAPIRLNELARNEATVSVYSETEGKPVNIKVLSDRVPDIRYDFNPSRGSVLATEAGRPFWGVLGGYFTQATERGGGESNDGTPFLRATDYPEGATKGAPDWVKTESGEDALQFDGKGTYVTLPQGVIPRLGSWTIDMDVKPDTVDGKQLLIGNRTYYMGSLVFYIEDGEITTEFYGQYSGSKSAKTGVQLPAERWSKLKISYDQKNLVITVGDKSSEPITIDGPGIYDTLSVVGGYGKDWFKGQVKSLRIRHTATL